MRISKSKINTYKRCPRQFKYIYVDKMPSEPNEYMQLGLDVHKVAENMGRILQQKDDVTEDDIIKASEESMIDSDFDISFHVDSLISFFIDIFDSGYRIVNVEDHIYDEKSNINGIIDLVLEDPETEELFVVDYKTSKSKPITDYRLELCMYRKLVESKYVGRTVSSAIIFFTKDSAYRGFNFANNQQKGSYVTDEDYDAVFLYIDFILDKIDNNVFPPKKQFLCQYCDFEDQCNQDGGF